MDSAVAIRGEVGLFSISMNCDNTSSDAKEVGAKDIGISPAFLRNGLLSSLFSDPQQVPSEPALHPSPEGQEWMAAPLEPTLSELLEDPRHDR